jgi:hypothetical protein
MMEHPAPALHVEALTIDAAIGTRIHREFTPLIYNCQKNHMDEEHPAKRKKSRWRPTSRGAMRIFAALIAVSTLLFTGVGALLFLISVSAVATLDNVILLVLGVATVVAAVVVLILVGQQYEWTGFGKSVQLKSDNQEIQPRKTLWDWLQLFIVPLALAAIGFWFAAQQDAHQQEIEDAEVSKSYIGCVRLTDRMKATLSPWHLDELGILRHHRDDIRELSSNRDAIWGWDITARQTGNLKLYLNLRYAISRKSQEFRLIPDSPIYDEAIKATPPESDSTQKDTEQRATERPWWRRILGGIFERISGLFGG